MRKLDEFEDDYLEDDLDGSVNSSRYRLKKRSRRKNTLLFLLIIVCIIGGSVGVNSLFNGNDEQAEEGEQEQLKTEDDELSVDTGTKTDTDDSLEDRGIENDTNLVSPSESATVEDSVDVVEGKDIPDKKEISAQLEGNSQTEEKIIEHKVQSGDSLYKLSLKYYNSSKYQQFLAGFNKLNNSNDLQIGQSIKIPFPPVSEWHGEDDDYDISASTEEQTTDIPIHVVESGDSLYSISIKYYNTSKYQDLIVEHNRLDNPEALRVGQKLEIPSVSEVN